MSKAGAGYQITDLKSRILIAEQLGSPRFILAVADWLKVCYGDNGQ
jgi:hypothetical protein